MSLATQPIDSAAEDRPDLASRVERCFAAVLRDRLPPGADVRVFHEISTVPAGTAEPPAGAKYWAVHAVPAIEDPPNSGAWQLSVSVTAKGPLTIGDLDALATLFASWQTVDCEIRDRRSEYGFEMLTGEGVEIDLGAGTRTGAGIDYETSRSFSLWAQPSEVSAAAA